MESESSGFGKCPTFQVPVGSSNRGILGQAYFFLFKVNHLFSLADGETGILCEAGRVLWALENAE